ncbi:MAG: glycoside hydrolase family 18 protein [Herpetosiphonaceae bacterium]|nr:glycoside hydrolase family 18 protein [Herpetosiphonaceae bacterium]
MSGISRRRSQCAILATMVLLIGFGALQAQARPALSLLLPTFKVYQPLLLNPGGAPRWVSGYYVGYQRDLYPVAAVDFSAITHLIVGRIRPASDGSVITDFDIDPVNGPAMARALADRAHQNNRKAILMLGGAGEHAGFVAAAQPARRAAFVQNLLATLDDLGYDGIDVDWEPILDSDRPLLLALLQDLRAARPGILLTIPVGWVNANFPGAVDAYYAQLAGLVNQINIMSYDMAGNWDGWESWHFAALGGHSPSRPSSIETSVGSYLSAGVPAVKLGIGIGFYGSCWRGVTQPRQPLNGQVSQGESDNAMSYANIMQHYYQPAVRSFDALAKVPYLSSAAGLGPQSCTFISYEDAESIAAKGTYVRSQGLGGTIIWTIGQGHIATAPVGSRDPLLLAVRQAFLDP